MIFGPCPLNDALGAVLAHSIQTGEGKLAKGSVLGPSDIDRLRAEGHDLVEVARLEPGDVGEDAAATRLALALLPQAQAGLRITLAHTGRVNLIATGPGLLSYDENAVHALNLTHPAITLATLPPLARLAPGTLAATVKIITYAVPETALMLAEQAARGAAMRHLAPVCRTAGLVLTGTGPKDDKLAAKGRSAMASRLNALGVDLVDIALVAHDEAALASALTQIKGDILLILTSAATSDLMDTAPAALRRAGGSVARFGMPVDPGNLLFHGQLGNRPVIGLPGCARSPALNGADWVLDRLVCGVPVSDEMVARMGVGGLLKEIPIRPLPRQHGKAG